MLHPDIRHHRHPHCEQRSQSGGDHTAGPRRQMRWLGRGKQQKAEHDGDTRVEETCAHQIEWEDGVRQYKDGDRPNGARRKHKPAGRDAKCQSSVDEHGAEHVESEGVVDEWACNLHELVVRAHPVSRRRRVAQHRQRRQKQRSGHHRHQQHRPDDYGTTIPHGVQLGAADQDQEKYQPHQVTEEQQDRCCRRSHDGCGRPTLAPGKPPGGAQHCQAVADLPVQEAQ